MGTWLAESMVNYRSPRTERRDLDYLSIVHALSR